MSHERLSRLLPVEYPAPRGTVRAEAPPPRVARLLPLCGVLAGAGVGVAGGDGDDVSVGCVAAAAAAVARLSATAVRIAAAHAAPSPPSERTQ